MPGFVRVGLTLAARVAWAASGGFREFPSECFALGAGYGGTRGCCSLLQGIVMVLVRVPGLRVKTLVCSQTRQRRHFAPSPSWRRCHGVLVSPVGPGRDVRLALSFLLYFSICFVREFSFNLVSFGRVLSVLLLYKQDESLFQGAGVSIYLCI